MYFYVGSLSYFQLLASLPMSIKIIDLRITLHIWLSLGRLVILNTNLRLG